MKAKRNKIRSRILAAFWCVLFVSFLLIGIILNIAISQYIRFSAIAHLENPDSNMFMVDSYNNPILAQDHSRGMLEILQTVRNNGISLSGLRNELMHTAYGIYYVTSNFVQDGQYPGGAYRVAYVDVTGFMSLAREINIIMLILVGVMFVISAFVTFFLSNSITRPIEKLSMFALGIGRGDFTPNIFEFKDKELEDLNIALNKSVKQLAVYDSEQKTFFQNVSHELRTPLMSIKCYAEGISYGIMEPKEACETILHETDRLSELVTDLLYVSKIDNITTVYTAEILDLTDIIRSCAARQQAVADKRGIRFSFDFNKDTIHYKCVRELLSRAIDNLISNAIRYAASEIVLSCHRKNDRIEIGVADDGDGIEHEVMPHVFERFCKGKHGDFGIGLSIVKSIVEQQGGRVTAENSSNGGAIFTVALPA